jgi:hypothetical protein
MKLQNEPKYIPFTFETFHKNRDRWYYDKSDKISNPENYNLLRPGYYDGNTMDGYTWADAFESLEFEMGEPFGNKLK